MTKERDNAECSFQHTASDEPGLSGEAATGPGAAALRSHCRKPYVIPMPSWVFGVGGAYLMQDLTFNQSGSQIQHCPQMSESGLS